MPNFNSIEEVWRVVRQILASAPTAAEAKYRIKGLPGPSSVRSGIGGPVSDRIEPVRGMHFDIPGKVTVQFKEDGRRIASFVVAREHDDPNPTHMYIVWPAPEPAASS